MHAKRILVLAMFLGFLLNSGARAQLSAPLDRGSGSSIRILNVQPPQTAALPASKESRVTAEIEYVLAAETGHVTVFIQNDDGQSVAVNTTGARLKKGGGRVTVSANILPTPGTHAIHFIVALYHSEGHSSAITASRTLIVQ